MECEEGEDVWWARVRVWWRRDEDESELWPMIVMRVKVNGVMVMAMVIVKGVLAYKPRTQLRSQCTHARDV